MSRTAWICITMMVLGAVTLNGAMKFLSPEPALAANASGGQFQVASSDNHFVLIDTASGSAWILMPKEGKTKQAWFPLKRLDTVMDMQKWKLMKD